MKVVFVKSHYIKAGGIETLLRLVFSRIDKSRFEIETFAISHVPIDELTFIDPEEVRRNPASLQVIPWSGLKSLPKVVRIARKMVEQSRPDVIYTHDMRANLVFFCVSFFNKTPWVSHVHGWLGKSAGFRNCFFEWIDQKLIKRASLVAVGSNTLRKRILTTCGVKDVRLITNSIDTKFFTDTCDWDRNLRAKLFPDFDGVIIGSFGRLHLGKGNHVLVAAMGQLLKKYPNIRCIILGEGPEEDSLKQQARDLGVEANILFPGFVDEPRSYLNMLDIVVTCSLAESLPLALLESICLGKPAVATDVGDLSRVLDFGKEDLIVPPGDVGSLCQALDKLIAQPELRERYGKLCQEKVQTEYSIDAAVSQMQDMLQEFKGQGQ